MRILETLTQACIIYIMINIMTLRNKIVLQLQGAIAREICYPDKYHFSSLRFLLL